MFSKLRLRMYNCTLCKDHMCGVKNSRCTCKEVTLPSLNLALQLKVKQISHGFAKKKNVQCSNETWFWIENLKVFHTGAGTTLGISRFRSKTSTFFSPDSTCRDEINWLWPQTKVSPQSPWLVQTHPPKRGHNQWQIGKSGSPIDLTKMIVQNHSRGMKF